MEAACIQQLSVGSSSLYTHQVVKGSREEPWLQSCGGEKIKTKVEREPVHSSVVVSTPASGWTANLRWLDHQMFLVWGLIGP